MKHIVDLFWSELKKLIQQKKNKVNRAEFGSRRILVDMYLIL